MPWPVQAPMTGLGKSRILDNISKPLLDMLLIASTSPEPITFKSKPAENIPFDPLIIRQPESVGTLSKQLLTSLIIAGEKTFALPSFRVMIEISPSFVRIAFGLSIKNTFKKLIYFNFIF